MIALTPQMITTAEEVLLLIGIMAAAGWYIAHRTRSDGTPPLPRAWDGGAAIEKAPTRYHPIFAAIHWLVAFGMANLLLRGALVMRYISNSDPAKIDGLRAHMLAGTAVLILMAIRLVLRRKMRHPPRVTACNHHLDRLAVLSHRLLYLLVIAQASSGLFMAWQTGLPEVVLAGQGSLPTDFWVFPIRRVHYALSRALMAVIALHLTGAFYHTLVLRDGLLRRMGFGHASLPTVSIPQKSEPRR